MKLSPWFLSSDLPVRIGFYEVKNWSGQISKAEWNGIVFVRAGLSIPNPFIRHWRGIVK